MKNLPQWARYLCYGLLLSIPLFLYLVTKVLSADFIPYESLKTWWPVDKMVSATAESDSAESDSADSLTARNVEQGLNGRRADRLVEVVDAPSLGLSTGEFTVVVWVKPDHCSVASGDAIPFVTKESNTPFDAFALGIAAGGRFGFTASEDARAWQTLILAGTCRSGAWQHVVATHQKDIAKLYVDGILVGTDTSAVIPLHSGLPMFLGYREDVSSRPGLQSRYYGGQLEPPEIFDRALSEDEILALRDGRAQN